MSYAVLPKSNGPSRQVWADDGTDVTYPIPLSETRKRKFVQVQYFPLWDTILEYFGDRAIVEEVDENAYPSFGSAWYYNDNGVCRLWRQNWDSSD